jgi:hypothetical protein
VQYSFAQSWEFSVGRRAGAEVRDEKHAGAMAAPFRWVADVLKAWESA